MKSGCNPSITYYNLHTLSTPLQNIFAGWAWNSGPAAGNQSCATKNRRCDGHMKNIRPWDGAGGTGRRVRCRTASSRRNDDHRPRHAASCECWHVGPRWRMVGCGCCDGYFRRLRTGRWCCDRCRLWRPKPKACSSRSWGHRVRNRHGSMNGRGVAG